MTVYITIIVFLLMIISFAANKIPMAATAVAGMVMLVITGCVEPAQALSNIGSSTVVTMASMFVIAEGLRQTQMLDKLSALVFKVSKGSFTAVLAGYVIVTFIIAQFVPTITAVFAIVCPLVMSMCDEMNISPSKMMYSIGLTTVATAYTLTPIGPYAANYIENNGYLTEYGIEGFTNTIFTEMSIKLPVAIVVILYAIFIAPKFAPDTPTVPIKMTEYKKGEDKKKLSPVREFLGYAVFIAVIICLIFNSFGLPTWVIPTLGAVVLVIAGVLDERTAVRALNIEILLLYVGVVTLGNALTATGAGEMIGNAVLAIIGDTRNSYAIGAVFFIASFVMTSLLYNRAVSKILLPILLAVCATIKCDPRGLMQMCYIGTMSSLLTPMATTVVPMMMGAGGYNQKDLLKMGWLPSIIMCVVTVLVGMTLYPCFP